MEYAEDQNLVRIGRANLIDDDVGQPAHDPLMGTFDLTGMSHAWELGQAFGRQSDSRHNLRSRGRTAIPEVAVNWGDVVPRLCGIAQPYRPHDFQRAAICSSVANVAVSSRI